VRDGMMYWSEQGYVLRRAAAPESTADPYDPSGEKPDSQISCKAGRDGTVAVPGRLNTVIVQVDAGGAVLSFRSFEGQAARLAVDGAGNAVVAGSASDRSFIDLMDPRVRGARTEVTFAGRFDPTGALLSVNRVDSPALSDVATGEDGAVFIAFGANVARFDRR
jgi:hypothetical protein